MPSLLATKLHRPRLLPKRVERPHLIERLNQGLQAGRQLTLISAPAGFGKTSCAAEWVSGLGLPVGWLSLDPADNDPGWFFAYLIATLQKVDPSLGRELEGVLRAGQLPPGEILSATLINDMSALEASFLLVLDDFQVIQDAFILQVLETLVENLPPSLHLVLLTRQDPALPLAKLRAGNQLTEIRARDLRFTSAEAGQFLGQVMGLALSPAEVATLEERTEGWAAGLHLAGLSIQGRPDPAAFIASLSGSHRFILGYLSEEVIARQPAEVQDFLLQTALLDRLNGELCDAVTGRQDSHALLEQLLAANLFLIPLDDEQHWYRYHQLFADLLRARQNSRPKEETAGLHRRASQWYHAAGMAGEAIGHALAAEDYALAVQLIESYTLDMLMQWHLKTVEGWMQAIPPAWSARGPKLNLAFAWMYLLRGAYPLAAPYIERLQRIFSPAGPAQPGAPAAPSPEAGDPALQAEWLALQCMLLNAQGKATESLQVGYRALELAPPENEHVHSLIYSGLASAYQQLDDYPRAVEAYQQLIRYGRAAGNLVSELLGIAGLGLLLIQRGELQQAFELATQGIERVERSGTLPPISTALYGELGVIDFHRHQIDDALQHFRRAIQVSALSGLSDAEIYYGVILARLQRMAGDLPAAAGELHKTVEHMQAEAPAAVREEVIAEQVSLYLAQGQLAEAEATLKDQGFSFAGPFTYPPLDPWQRLAYPKGLLYLSALRILLHRIRAGVAAGQESAGLALAGRLLEETQQRQYPLLAIETLLLRGHMQAALEPESEAAGLDFSRALELAEPQGYITPFVEDGPGVAAALRGWLERKRSGTAAPGFVEQILAAFPTPRQPAEAISTRTVPATQELVEPLSQRELELLQLIEAGLSNQEIAARLVITLHTVKKHTSNIYTKLGVTSRTQAVARSRQLGLL